MPWYLLSIYSYDMKTINDCFIYYLKLILCTNSYLFSFKNKKYTYPLYEIYLISIYIYIIFLFIWINKKIAPCLKSLNYIILNITFFQICISFLFISLIDFGYKILTYEKILIFDYDFGTVIPSEIREVMYKVIFSSYFAIFLYE